MSVDVDRGVDGLSGVFVDPLKCVTNVVEMPGFVGIEHEARMSWKLFLGSF